MNANYDTTSQSALDKEPFLSAMQASQLLHADWVTVPLTQEDFLSYLEKYASDVNISYLICCDEAIAGVINMNEIIRGSFQSTYLGYYAVGAYAKKGVMAQGLIGVMTLALREHGLHRLEANIQPKNVDSISLVKKCGFRKEGFSLRYLKVMGKWCDHERWAITLEDFDSMSE